MDKPDRSTYTPLDFREWREAGGLVLVPKFQRRGVWTTPARSYFIDTLIRALPVPPIYLRIAQSKDRSHVVREVVDGQQRISAVLDYIDEEYALTRSMDSPYAGNWFSELGTDEQDAIRQYSFNCEVFQNVPDAEILEVFSRLNMFSVKLNAQELRNGTYFGFFKQAAYRLAHEHLEFWRRHRIFTERRIARMLEVELTSELMIAQLAGLQDKKGNIGDFYSEYDSSFPRRRQVETRFRATVDAIQDSVGDVLSQGEFRRPPLFYTLSCVVYHRSHGLPRQKRATPKKALGAKEAKGLSTAIVELSDVIAAGRAEERVPSRLLAFVNACLRQTDNIHPRQVRFDKLYELAF